MLSYVLSSNSLRNYPLQILNMSDKSMLTTIPQHARENVFFHKDSVHTLSHQSQNHLFQFTVRFSKLKSVGENTFYHFDLLKTKMLKNVRREPRKAVSYPASFIHKNFNTTRLGCIVDISESGLKLETLHPIEAKEIHISYEDHTKKRYKIAQIVWENKQDDFYYYGLKLIADL